MSETVIGRSPLDPSYSDVIRLLRECGSESKSYPETRIALLRNITIDPIVTYLRWFCLENRIRPEVYVGDFDNVPQDVLNASSPLYDFAPDIVILVLHRDALLGRLAHEFVTMSTQEVQSEIEGVLTHLRATTQAIRRHTDATILINNFENVVYPSLGVLDYQSPHRQINTIRRLNDQLVDLCSSQSSTYLVDVDLLQSVLGYAAFHDNRYWHLARAPYSLAGARLIALEYSRFIVALRGRTRKCLVLDCDNTLWGGILGEDGPDGIQVGSAFVAFQRSILQLHQKGIMLALCSKNDERDVLDVLDRHQEMVLRRRHFVSLKINWNDKATNLREIALDVNIGLDSFVFADDSPFEINLVRQLLPEVEVLELSGDPADFSDLLGSRGLFDALTFSEEDRMRNERYLADQERATAATSIAHESIEDYYRFLEMEVTICDADTASVPRVAQLTQKTNQFNLTTHRYSDAQIRDLLANGESQVRIARVEDRFGDSGIAGLTVLKYHGEDCVIDTFLLSCRVIGRGIEDCLLKDCELLARARGACRIIGHYIPTAKNPQVASFYTTRGFKPAGAEEHDFMLPLAESTLTFPSYFKLIRREPAAR